MNTVFHQLFIFEMANNHQGSVEHGRRIIDAMGDVAKEHTINAAVKFQFRELDTFIHKDFRDSKDVKHVDRFLSTRLSEEEFADLVAYTKDKGLLAMATPFDEASVNQCLEQDVDIIKIASCSAQDWPLLEVVAEAGKPVIASTGGVELENIDKIVSFFSHKEVDFALMHCVGVYPTPADKLNMNMISRFTARYPGISIGYSGHEAPDALEPVIVAVSKGAKLLERHVGVEHGDITLNAYSMNPKQTSNWVKAALDAYVIAGSYSKEVTDDEKDSLATLMRGTYARKPIQKGQEITRDDVYFAMPLQHGQLTSGEYGSYRATYKATKDYAEDEPIVEPTTTDPILLVRNAIHEAKGMLNEANISVGTGCSIELSHHRGMEHFHEMGATIVNIINREYCKKFVVVFPGQKHPSHRHEKKEETFELLSGEMEVHLDDEIIQMQPGDRLLIKRNTWHSFSSEKGAIFEEISTTHYRDDSEYEDESISKLDPMERKTVIDPWNG